MDSEDMYEDRPMRERKGGKKMADVDEERPAGLLPESFFHGKNLKPGDTCTIKVEKVYDDGQVEVSYVSKETNKTEMQAPETDTEMEEMMT